jgi:hypothetical protein
MVATQLNLPLIVGEGSIDAGAWRNPDIFLEESYARQEIDLYTRILNICQPRSILQWQLTADYSVLTGGGVFGNNKDPLQPTQRFWNLKQLSITPSGLFALPISSDKENVTVAALGDQQKNIYAIHLVNNGPTREVILTGLPLKIIKLFVLVTDNNKKMQFQKRIKTSSGTAQFVLDSRSFTTLIGGKVKKKKLTSVLPLI